MFDFINSIFARKKEKTLLKDSLSELRLMGEAKDAYSLVSLLKAKKARFLGGGLFEDVVYAKEYGDGVYTFFILRKERNTGKDSVLFDGHSINEKEDLGISLESVYSVADDLQKLGYSFVFERKVEEWMFFYKGISLKISDVVELGVFIEATVPSSKDEENYKLIERNAINVMKELVKEFDYVDLLTLQLIELKSKQK